MQINRYNLFWFIRKLFLTLATTMVLSNFCFGQEMTYVKGGTVSLNNEILKEPKNLLPILKKNKRPN